MMALKALLRVVGAVLLVFDATASNCTGDSGDAYDFTGQAYAGQRVLALVNGNPRSSKNKDAGDNLTWVCYGTYEARHTAYSRAIKYGDSTLMTTTYAEGVEIVALPVNPSAPDGSDVNCGLEMVNNAYNTKLDAPLSVGASNVVVWTADDAFELVDAVPRALGDPAAFVLGNDGGTTDCTFTTPLGDFVVAARSRAVVNVTDACAAAAGGFAVAADCGGLRASATYCSGAFCPGASTYFGVVYDEDGAGIRLERTQATACGSYRTTAESLALAPAHVNFVVLTPAPKLLQLKIFDTQDFPEVDTFVLANFAEDASGLENPSAGYCRFVDASGYVGADGLAIEAYSFYEDVCDRVAADGGYETMRADCKSFDPSGARVVSTAATFCADAFCPGSATLFATLDDGEGGVFVARALGAPCGKGHCGSA
ncbi:hypothetical protein JL720_1765 [Aureococcus anophagefferens]|nr:hypothetical protein JL720_1765 [Aureococcus anophagefferens]